MISHKQTEIIKSTTLLLIAVVITISMSTGKAFATSNEYHDGYETGCSDASSSDKIIKESDGLTDQFKLGYEHGYLECSGFDRNNFNCEEGSDGCNGQVYCSKIDSDVAISCYDEAD